MDCFSLKLFVFVQCSLFDDFESMLLQKLHFFGRDYVLLTLSAQKYTPLYEKGIKQNQNK